MLSRRAHLIYKIKLKASHARMAFCDDYDDDDDNDDDGGNDDDDGEQEERNPFSCT